MGPFVSRIVMMIMVVCEAESYSRNSLIVAKDKAWKESNSFREIFFPCISHSLFLVQSE